MSSTNGHHVNPQNGTCNGNSEAGEGVPKIQNGLLRNGVHTIRVKEEDEGIIIDPPQHLKNGNGINSNQLNSAVKSEEDVLMNGIEEIKIADMDVDDDGDIEIGFTYGGSKRVESLKKGVSSKLTHLNSCERDGTMKMGNASENGVVVTASLPPPKCANGKLICTLDGSSSYPCKRCHRVFYCSDDHRQQQYTDHQPDCRTVSTLDVLFDEDYTLWLKHSAPHLYDTCLNFVLVWPSLTAQWLPEIIERENNVLRHHLLIGTMTNQEQNHLLICAIDIPDRTNKTDNASDHAAKYDGTMYVVKRINHEAEVNRARYMPQDSNVIATKSSSPEVFIFDVRKHPDVPEDSTFAPLIRLRGHQKEGFGLSWNLKEGGKLISGSDDALVCLWDLNKSTSTDNNNIKYLAVNRTFRGHEDVVEDVDWHPEQRNLFASVGDDKKLIVWDTRTAISEEAVHICSDAHQRDINAVSFSPFVETCLATGSSDSTVAIWDMRNMNKKLHSLEYHQAEVMQVQWSPHNSSILASTGKDNRVFVWDLSKVGKTIEMQQSMEEDPAPSELTFIHGGHTANVNDISWNHHDMGMMASVTEDNILQVWKISEDLQAVYKGDDSDNDSVGSTSEIFDE